MNVTTKSIPITSATSIIFGLFAAILLFFVLTDQKIPVISNERFGLIALLLFGMATCTFGIGRVADTGAWLHPLAILGYLLGAAILIIGVAALFGLYLPFVSSSRQAIILIGVLGIGKLILSSLHRLILSSFV